MGPGLDPEENPFKFQSGSLETVHTGGGVGVREPDHENFPKGLDVSSDP